MFPLAVAVLLVALFAWLVWGKQIDVLAPAGVVASQQHQVLMFALFLSALVVIPVFTLLAYFSVKYRASNKNANYDPNWGDNKILEGMWWGIPIAIIGVLGVITFQTSHSLDPYKPIEGGKTLNVQVVGLQWKWLFIYPDYNVAAVSHAPMPINQPVHFSLTAEAPMSAFWIPALGSQIYTMNGMESQLNLKATKLGEYTGYNTNINGEGYASMKFTAKVMSKDGFLDWVATTKRDNNILTMDTYEKLAKPSLKTSEESYVLADGDLFNTILERNMSHGGHGNE